MKKGKNNEKKKDRKNMTEKIERGIEESDLAERERQIQRKIEKGIKIEIQKGIEKGIEEREDD